MTYTAETNGTQYTIKEIVTKEDIDGQEFQEYNIVGTYSLSQLENMKAGKQAEIDKIDDKITAINNLS